MRFQRISIKSILSLSVMGAIVALTGCQSQQAQRQGEAVLQPVAFSDQQWTGVAVSSGDRIFVNYPRWSDDVPLSVAELIDGQPRAYPNVAMNQWMPGKDPASHFVCVQAVYADDRDVLWILDPANPKFQGVVAGGPKLVQVDLATNEIVRTYRFGSDVALPASYLNDVRIDHRHGYAYMTDSGTGALVVLNLQTGSARRVLDEHASASAEGVTLNIGGKPWLRNGQPPQVQADGIAFDAEGDVIYYQALSGRTMYSVPAAALRNANLTPAELAAQVTEVGKTGSSDGLVYAPDGHVYITALEHDAILRTTSNGVVETVVQDVAIAWPDTFSLGPDGWLYFTTARIHEGSEPLDRYGLYRIQLRD